MIERTRPGADQVTELNITRFRNTLKTASNKILFGAKPIGVLDFVVSSFPQAVNGRIYYLITAGLAIEKYTGITRKHRDIDIVTVDKDILVDFHPRKVDAVSPNNYWCQMVMSNEFLINTSVLLTESLTGRHYRLVHPGIIFIQKLSNHHQKEPRMREFLDVHSLIRYASLNSNLDTFQWKCITNLALSSLPAPEQNTTRERIQKFEMFHGIDLI